MAPSPSGCHSAGSSSTKKDKSKRKRKIEFKLTENTTSADAPEQASANPLIIPPILASFPNGLPTNVDKLSFKCHATESQGGKRRRRLELKAETDHVKYEANQLAVSRKVSASYLVGIYLKQKQEVVLYPIEAIIPMTQSVKAMEGEEIEDSRTTEASYAERRKSLVDTFGTKKKRKVMQSREDNRISAEGVVGMSALGGFLSESTKAIQEDAEKAGNVSTAAEASRATLLPPYDANANKVEKVYLPRKMFGAQEREEEEGEGVSWWESLEEDLDQVLSQAAAAGGDMTQSFRNTLLDGWRYWPMYVRTRIQNASLPSTRGGGEGGGQGGLDVRREAICCLMLLRHLFELQRLPPIVKGGETYLASTLSIQEPLAAVFLSSFFQPEGGGGGGGMKHFRNKPLSDKLVLHILVLCLIVGNYSNVSVTKVAQDLRISAPDCATLFRETGATTKKTAYGSTTADVEEEEGGGGGSAKLKGRKSPGADRQADVIAKLSVPLVFPQLKRYRPRPTSKG